MTDRNEPAEELLETLGPRIHRLLVRLTLSEHVAEDLLQDLFVKLLTRPSVANIEHTSAYLRRAAIHSAFDWRRRQQLRKCQPLSDEAFCNEPNIGKRLEVQEQVEKVLDALEKLPPTQRDVVVLRFFENQSYDEIAELLGKSPHQIRSILHKGIVRLRKTLNAPSESI